MLSPKRELMGWTLGELAVDSAEMMRIPVAMQCLSRAGWLLCLLSAVPADCCACWAVVQFECSPEGWHTDPGEYSFHSYPSPLFEISYWHFKSRSRFAGGSLHALL